MAREMRTFEKHLEDELHVLLDAQAAGTIPAWRMPAQSSRSIVPFVGGAGAALGAKILTGAAIAVLAAGATTEIVITHSANPIDWARNVQQQVQPSTGSQGGPHSQPTSAVHPSASSVGGGSPAVPPRVSPPSLPAVTPPALPSVTPLPIPTASVPPLP